MPNFRLDEPVVEGGLRPLREPADATGGTILRGKSEPSPERDSI